MERVRKGASQVRRFATFMLLTVFAAGMAIGQSGKEMNFDIPFAFTAGSKMLPAGSYMLSLSQQAPMRLRVQSSKNGSSWVNVVAPLKGQSELFPGGYLVFDKSAKGLTLSEVWMAGIDGALLRATAKGDERMLVVSGPRFDSKRAYSGKEVFDMTCAKCHGEKGKGNEAADKFFGTKIPHLASEQIRGLPDEAFRTQIEMGNGKMPPVEVNEGGYQHRLPKQYVDELIAYVRSLKE